MTERTVAIDYITRVEGEGALKVRLDGKKISQLELRIFEPPRFFEAFLRGRDATEAPDITARICGICPVAYQMSACQAVERALGMRVEGALRDLRRVLYCGEWIESHALHAYLLHAPDFLGYPDALSLAKDHPAAVRQGLALKKAGNELMTIIGGREIHPVNVRVGGFYRLPSPEELDRMKALLQAALPLAEATVLFAAGLTFPKIEEEYEFVSLRHPEEYPMMDGKLVSSAGLSIEQEEFEEHFEEIHAPYSNALQSVRKGAGAYLVGPLARYSLNSDRLTPRAAAAARAAGLGKVERNPYRSIIVRAVELVYACEEGLRLLERYRAPPKASVELPLTFHGGVGRAITEAPRGILFHRYRLAKDRRIEEARIVPPTAQNQKRIEDDVRHVVEASLDLDDAHLADVCEKAIRNYDPCISCATHFLRLDIERH
jgi:coenzyme F420-reducing hydrogenase alpha subunit